MSKKIKERTKELATKEVAIKKKLLGKTDGLQSKASKIGKTALIGGLVALLIYGLYKAFFQGETKSKKTKLYGKSASGIVAEKVTTFLLPYLGKVLDNFLDKRSQAKEQTEENKEEDS